MITDFYSTSFRIKKMEFTYFLNHDCISNFEICNYCTYHQMLLTNKVISKRIYDLSILNLDCAKYDPKLLCNEKLFPVFRNLTFLRIHRIDRIERHMTINFIDYVKQYQFLHGSYPILRKLQTKYLLTVSGMTFLTNLVDVDIHDGTMTENLVKQLSRLTYLKSTAPQNYPMTSLHCLHNLKIFKILNIPMYMIETLNQSKYTNLQKLSVHFYNCRESIKISFPNLTYLRIETDLNKCNINLDNQTKLRCLKLKNTNIDNSIEYFRKASQLYRLECFQSDSRIELSCKNNPRLKYVVMRNVKELIQEF